MFRSEEKEEKEEKTNSQSASIYNYVRGAYGYVTSFFTPALPDCAEAIKLRGLLSQYKHKATWVIREMNRLYNSINILNLYQGHLRAYTTNDDIAINIGFLRCYVNFAKKLETHGPFLSEDEKTMSLQSKETFKEYFTKNNIDVDLNDPDCVTLKGIIRKMETSRIPSSPFSREISIAILDYIMFRDLLQLKEHYRFIEWEIDDASLAKMQAAEELLRANSFKINAFELKFETFFVLIGLRSRVDQLLQSIEKELQEIRLEFHINRLNIAETLDEIKCENERQAKVQESILRSQQLIHETGSEDAPEVEPLLGVWAPRFS